MFGLVQPCRHSLPGDLFTQWQAHLCGLCLSLRDGHGQAARLTTNTDAVMISVLTAAQQEAPEAITGAGACPLRAMRSAVVVDAADPGITLATAASLTLAAAKAGDVVAEQRHGLGRRSRVRATAARGVARRLERQAHAGPGTLDVDKVLATLSGQAALESSGAALAELTEPTAQACALVFAATADGAGNPANREHLARIGYDYGRLAHLLDAVEDRDRDARTGAYNPLTATGTTTADALADCRRLAAAIGDRYLQLRLHDDRLLRVVLLGGIRTAIARRDRTHACRRSSAPSAHDPHRRPPAPAPLPYPGPGPAPQVSQPQYPQPQYPQPQYHQPLDYPSRQQPGTPGGPPPPGWPPPGPPGPPGGGWDPQPGPPDPNLPPLPGGWPAVRPADWPEGWPYPPPFPKDRSFGERILPFLGTTCSGQACVTKHWGHCSDSYKAPCALECLGFCCVSACCESCC